MTGTAAEAGATLSSNVLLKAPAVAVKTTGPNPSSVTLLPLIEIMPDGDAFHVIGVPATVAVGTVKLAVTLAVVSIVFAR